jgi:hypothetical protein
MRHVGPVGWVVILLGGSALAVGILLQPVVTTIVVLAMAGVGMLGRLPRWSPRVVFPAAVGGLLAGYALFGRAFAYLGVWPVFVGEVVLATGFAAAVQGIGLTRVVRLPVTWFLLAFAFWGAVRTAPYVGTYGVNALRDAVLWGYGAFAVLVAASLLQTNLIPRVPHIYSRFVPLLLLWTPVGVVATYLLQDALPQLPDRDSTILVLANRTGDPAAHLAGAGAFLLLGLPGTVRTTGDRSSRLVEWGWWAAWVVGFLVTASQNRGGLLAVGVAFLVAMSFRPSLRWLKAIVILGLVAAVFWLLQLSPDLGRERSIAPSQIVKNLMSLGGGGDQDPGGTIQWRLEWWRELAHDALHGDDFWLGKGYGINLAVEHWGGRISDETATIRSPHNSHLTILARSGMPGFLLWMALQCAFAVSLIRAYSRACRAGDQGWAGVFVWVLAYWAAFMVHANFSVFLESPQGGIWFWSLMGFGMAAAAEQGSGHRQELPTHRLARSEGRRASRSTFADSAGEGR